MTHYLSLSDLIDDRKRALSKGPIALVLVEDDIEVKSTVVHLQKSGFAKIIAFSAAEIPLPDEIDRVDHNVLSDGALANIINAVVQATPGLWLHYCYNAEYLFFPFCEHRTVNELIGFSTEERRNSILSYVVDLYAGDLNADPTGVSRENAYVDGAGYYALARTDDTGVEIDRQMEFFGGLRWRFEEHIPYERRRIDRTSLFKVIPGLQMLQDRRFNVSEYNTYACPWHHSVTAATCSFRTAKALKRNPGSRHGIESFHWQNAVRFNWQSQQLCDLGLMEPGQWF